LRSQACSSKEKRVPGSKEEGRVSCFENRERKREEKITLRKKVRRGAFNRWDRVFLLFGKGEDLGQVPGSWMSVFSKKKTRLKPQKGTRCWVTSNGTEGTYSSHARLGKKKVVRLRRKKKKKKYVLRGGPHRFEETKKKTSFEQEKRHKNERL